MTESSPPRAETRYFQLANYNLILTSTFMAIDILVVGMRIWARKRQKLALWLDDWLIFAALILVIGSAATMISCECSNIQSGGSSWRYELSVK